jgi:hypothetical protein
MNEYLPPIFQLSIVKSYDYELIDGGKSGLIK